MLPIKVYPNIIINIKKCLEKNVCNVHKTRFKKHV